MSRLMNTANAVGICACAFVVYKAVELGPYEAAILFGRIVHVFVVAAQGHL